jgi:formate-dependent nitrite reductase membrane component NrfD
MGGAGAGAVALLAASDLLSWCRRWLPPRRAPSASRDARAPRDAVCRAPNAFRDDPCSSANFNSSHPLFAPGMAVATATLGLAAFCLLADLGRTDRALILFTRPTFSPVTVGTYALALLVICSLALILLANATQPPPRWAALVRRGLSVVVAVAALLVMLYTGLLFFSIGTGTLLGSLLLPTLFVLSSLSTGNALLLAVSYLLNLPFWGDRLFRLDSAIIALELLCLTVFLITAACDPLRAASFSTLTQGPYATLFWMGAVLCGLVAPLVLESRRFARRVASGVNLALPVALLVFTGGVCLRYSVLGAALPVPAA